MKIKHIEDRRGPGSLGTSRHLNSNNTSGSPPEAFGSNVATVMESPLFKYSQLNTGRFISTCLPKILEGLDASASVVQLVRSLVYPFVARRSLNRENFFPNFKEYNRFIESMRYTAQTIIKYVSDLNHEQKFIKFWLDTYLCKLFGDPELPPQEEWIKDPLFKGWCRLFVLRALCKGDTAFIYSLQKGTKKSWPSMSEQSKTKALEKHMERVSSFHGGVSSELRKVIKQVSSEVFAGLDQSKRTKFMPSGSACMQATVENGGVLSLFSPMDLKVVPESQTAKTIGKLPALNLAVDQWRRSRYLDSAIKATLNLRIHSDGNKNDSHPYIPANDVSVVAIPEPGKFRIITKGDGYLYTALQPLQGTLLSAWKRHRASTMLHDDLTERVNEIYANCKDHLTHWCSVDYEAATDLLRRDATFAALSGIPQGTPDVDLAKVSMLQGRAVYKLPGYKRKIVPCIDGQLMGHPLSFPLLCVINLSAYFLAVDIWLEKNSDLPKRFKIAKLMKRNVLVNGDDMLFMCPHDFQDCFRLACSDAGFKLSQGKNYFSTTRAMINSQVFQVRNGRMDRVGYLNQKILSGSSLKEGKSNATPTEISRELSKMVKLTPWTSSCIPAVMDRWSKDFKKSNFKPNWYLPVHLGGYGLDTSLTDGFTVTRLQRIVAARFIHNPKLALYRRTGFSLPVAEYANAVSKWKMIPGAYVPQQHEILDVDDEWLARIAYAFRASGKVCLKTDSLHKAFGLDKRSRLHPISREMLLQYWDAQVFTTGLPACPPLSLLPSHTHSLWRPWMETFVSFLSQPISYQLLSSSHLDDDSPDILVPRLDELLLTKFGFKLRLQALVSEDKAKLLKFKEILSYREEKW